MKKKNISILQILKTDRLSILFIGLFTGPLCLLIIALISIHIFGCVPMKNGGYLLEHDLPAIIIIPLISIIPSIFGLVARYWYFRNIIESNIEVNSIVENVMLDDSQFKTIDIKITYEYFGKVYHSETRVLDGNISRSIRKGSSVTVLLNPQKPKQFIIADLYAGR